MFSPKIVLLMCILPVFVFSMAAHFTGVAIVDGKGSLCQSCHSMSSHVASWSKSNHKGIRCSDCHLEGNTWFHRETDGLSLLLSCVKAEIRGGNVSERAVHTKVCISCHSPHYVVKPLSEEKHMPHPHKDCMSCHKGLVHGTYDTELLAMRVNRQGRSLKVDATFPEKISDSFTMKPHFQNGFVETMGFCGSCHQMSPSAQSPDAFVSSQSSSLCENCHIRY